MIFIFLKNLFKKKTTARSYRVCAIVPAAGSSVRMGGADKLLIEVCDMPVLGMTLAQLQACEYIDEIILVCREQDIVEYSRICRYYDIDKASHIITGGDTRAESVFKGIGMCSDDITHVAIHDAARPLVTDDILSETILKGVEYRAAAPCVELKDSVKRVRNGAIVKDINRSTIVSVQTPQVFEIGIIMDGFKKVFEENIKVTDDCKVLEVFDIPVHVVKGSYENIKITTEEDVYIAETILLNRG